MKKKLYLVDVSSMFFRAFYAIRELNTSEGFPTNALYGFLSMTIKLRNQFQPEYMVFCQDRKEPSFRKDLDPNYKANRTEMPEDLGKQIPYIHELTGALGIPQMSKELYEADDVIGSLAKWGEAQGMEVVIVSGDKDFAQLINENISMYDPMKKKTYNPLEVEKKWEVKAEQFIDYLSIVGDASDNIPGVKGIGPKGAVKLLKEFNDLESVYENLESQKGAALKKLTESKEAAFLSKKLVTIVTDLDLAKDLEEVKVASPNLEHLEELFTKLEFESFMKNFKSVEAEGEASAEQEVSLKEFKKISDFTNALKNHDRLDFIDSPLGEVLLIGDEAYSVPYDGELIASMAKKVSGMKLKWTGFNLKSFFKKMNLSDVLVEDDVQLMCYSQSSDAWDLKAAIEHFCEQEAFDTDSLGGLIEGYKALKLKMKSSLEGETLDLYKNIELPLMKVLLSMELKGVLLDKEVLAEQSKDLGERIESITQEVHSMVDKKFNLASPKQLSKILFEDLGLTPVKKTKTGFSTNTDVLEKLKSEHPICEKIIEFRELSKLKSTYVDALPKLVKSETERLHTTYNQALTTTGRLSSVSPNLQNIPIKTEEGRKVRQAFVAKKGYKLVSADYSQIELRVLAHISKDEALTEAFLKDQDVHARTAAEVFGVDLSEVNSEQRRKAKAVNFGIAYGQGAYGLSEALGVSRKEAKEIIESYFEKFSSVKNYIDETKEKANEDFFVKTLLGRVREIKELKSSNKMLKSFGERAAINAPIQGTASDLIKLAMIEAFENLDYDLLLQVHDELIFEVPEKDVEKASEQIKKIMENVYILSVPLKVNVDTGRNWDEAH